MDLPLGFAFAFSLFVGVYGIFEGLPSFVIAYYFGLAGFLLS